MPYFQDSMLNVTFCTILLIVITLIIAKCLLGKLSHTETFAPVALSNILSPDVNITADLNSNKCIDIGNNKRLSKLTLQNCSGQKNQRFWMSPFNGAIRSAQGMCLDIPNNQSANGVHVQIYDCNNSAAQKFDKVARDGKYYIQKQSTNLCLDLINANQANNTPIQLWDCNWTDQQRWQFKR